MKNLVLFLLAVLVLIAGCSTPHTVIVNTGTVLGISVAENPTTTMYEAKLGYARAEFASVPISTNSLGTLVVPDVLVELRMENMFKGGLVYQRLAVGENAVKQPGAALMFAKNAEGEVSPAALAAIQNIPSPDAIAVSNAVPLAKAYQASDKKEAFDAVARKSGYASFKAFLVDPKLTPDKVKTVSTDLANLGLITP